MLKIVTFVAINICVNSLGFPFPTSAKKVKFFVFTCDLIAIQFPNMRSHASYFTSSCVSVSMLVNGGGGAVALLKCIWQVGRCCGSHLNTCHYAFRWKFKDPIGFWFFWVYVQGVSLHWRMKLRKFWKLWFNTVKSCVVCFNEKEQKSNFIN